MKGIWRMAVASTHFVVWLRSWKRSELARRLGTGRSTIDNWITYRNLPNAPIMKRIQLLSGGRITYARMIDEYLANQK